RVRFAPSPTGYLHVGGARTALFNWLYARQHGGTFILRIEDTDVQRSSEAMVQGILEGMHWLGLDADEGPFFQSSFVEAHRAAARRLVEEGKAYYDFTPKEQGDDKTIKERIREQALAGKEPNPYRDLPLYEALGVQVPRFGHLPLINAPGKEKLSKRKHGEIVSVTTYRDRGFLPDAFVNFLALLGWSPGSDQEIMSRQELIDKFSLDGVNKAAAIFNFKENDPF